MPFSITVEPDFKKFEKNKLGLVLVVPIAKNSDFLYEIFGPLNLENQTNITVLNVRYGALLWMPFSITVEPDF